ncbi:MAG: Brp/Blh family beta-carotene 15,15'-dioxygenase [Pseudomonadota bacterium]
MNFGTLLISSLFLVLASAWIIAPTYAEWLALILMICAGIPHGSFDLRVARSKWQASQVSKAVIIIGYLMCAVLMTALCVFLPLFGLILFLAISVAHFAEGEALSADSPDWIRGALFGTCSILIPIGLHSDLAQLYTSYFVPAAIFESCKPVLVTGAYFFTALAVLLLTRDLIGGRAAGRLTTIERLVALAAWVILPPLSGFAVWFIGRHSRLHLELCSSMFNSTGLRIPFDFAAISLLAILGLSPFAMLFDFSNINQLFAASLSLIAGLTLPHMIVSHGMRGVLEQHAEHEAGAV